VTFRIHSITFDCRQWEPLVEFWSQASTFVEDPDDPNNPGDPVGMLVDPDSGARLLFIPVPEPKTVKNRVHVDLRAADTPGDLLSRQDGFTVRADPEGNEFCVFPGPGAPELAAVCTDSPDPAAIAAWWAPLLGARVEPGPDGVPRYLAGGAGFAEGVLWKFVPVDDPRTVKNRWHWDVYAEPADLVAAGAVVLRERDDAIRWTVLADPDGNEFCAFAPSA
jgi:hypothetical protein